MQTTTLAVTVLMAAVYVFGVRLVDFNEKEPLWAVLLLFVFGAAASAVVLLTVGGAFIALNPVPGALTVEVARFAGIGGGVGVLTLIGLRRGYSEINGLMDGVVYGSAGGLGYATGLAFTSELLLPTSDMMVGSASLGYGEIALVGLSDAVFGALMGIGFAGALEASNQLKRVVFPIGGLVAASLAHLAYDYIGTGDPFGNAAMVRKWIALCLPLLGVVAVAIIALGGERKAIVEELEKERESGAVTDEELKVLQSWMSRQALYFGRLFRADIGGYRNLHGLHNRQVKLAMAKRKVMTETDAARKEQSAGEVARLRQAVFEIKQAMGQNAGGRA